MWFPFPNKLNAKCYSCLSFGSSYYLGLRTPKGYVNLCCDLCYLWKRAVLNVPSQFLLLGIFERKKSPPPAKKYWTSVHNRCARQNPHYAPNLPVGMENNSLLGVKVQTFYKYFKKLSDVYLIWNSNWIWGIWKKSIFAYLKFDICIPSKILSHDPCPNFNFPA